MPQNLEVSAPRKQPCYSKMYEFDVCTIRCLQVQMSTSGSQSSAEQCTVRRKLIKEHICSGKSRLSSHKSIDTLDIQACGHCGKSLITAEQYFGQGVIRQNNQIRSAVEKYWPKIDVYACDKCKTEVYCSGSCRTEAWEDYHQILCSSVNKNVEKLHQVCHQFKKLREENCRVWDGVWNAAFSPVTIAQLWARIICDAKRIAKARGGTTPDRQDMAKAKAKYRRFIAYGSAKNAKVVPRMMTIMREIFSDLSDGVTLEITDKEFEGRYFQIACNIQEFADPEPPYKLFVANAKSKPQVWACVSPHIRSEPPEATFTGLFMLHACMNHSCDNNAEVRDRFVDGKPGIALQAKKPISEGQEVTISYIDTRMCRQDRQSWLYQSYNFWCTCTKCQFEGDDASSCTNCKKQASRDKLFPACSRCHRAWYCSSHCQKVAWKKGHKSICNK
ncbi:SET and MYND domain-containing protein 5-like [Pecten maximus]|uniref:SET and MYND domain-containing protein 5-like n=1 Tax=Pecten maximus TaxID=6579 RepID=UPI0014584921|nr:SET and MYND domain-containing protein 5-like [Pecten maximus]